MWWWWRASRVIHDRDPAGNSMEVISEFPFFSFLLGDNHPHVLTLPFVLLALALALNLLLATRRRAAPEQEVAEPAETSPAPNLGRRITTFVGSLWDGGTFDWLMWAVVLGGLGFMNTWDYPIYLGIFVLVYAIRRQWSRAADLHWATEVIVFGGLLLLAGLVLYAPFYLGFRSQAAGIGLVGEVKTRLHQYLLMMGVFIFFVASVLVALAVRYLRLSPEERELPLLGQFGGIALGVVAAFGAVQGWWTVALVFALSALAAALLAWGSVHRAKGEPGTRLPPSVLFGLVMILAGLMLTGSVEFIFLRDTFGTRMNTVFKFYYQAWVLLALASASGAYYVYERLRRANRLALVTWSAVGALLVAAGLSYTVAATVSKAGDPEELTLDGTRYIERYRSADYHAVQWLREHAPEDAVMVEATGGSYSEYNWVSAHTGIPTLLGWGGHELQWRGSYDIPGQREPDIARIYQSTQPQPARDLLERYGVDYVYVGPLERQKYNLSPPMLQKFDRIMRRVYENDGVVIYGW
jgi:YYY domain-containing protein